VAYNTSPAVNANDAPVPPFAGNNVPASVTVPFVAVDGVNPVDPALNDVTLIEEMSAATKLLNVGTPADPLGLAYIRFAAWDALVIVSVPDIVMGDPVTVNSEGADNATLVTDPPIAGVTQVGAAPPLTDRY